MSNVIQLFPAWCSKCSKPIRKYERYINLRGPDGDEMKLHPDCMGGVEIDPEPPSGGTPAALAIAA